MNTLWGWGRASWAGCGPDVRRGGQTLIMGYSADKSPLIGHLAGPIRRLEPLGAQRQEKCGPNRPTPTGYSCNNAGGLRRGNEMCGDARLRRHLPVDHRVQRVRNVGQRYLVHIAAAFVVDDTTHEACLSGDIPNRTRESYSAPVCIASLTRAESRTASRVRCPIRSRPSPTPAARPMRDSRAASTCGGTCRGLCVW